MFGRKRPPAPAPEAKPASTPADDIKEIKDWIRDISEPARKESIRREQVNRDNITRTNNRCSDLNKDTRNLWKEKDAEKQARDLEIAELHRIIRQLRTELSKKANKAKTSKPAKA